MSAMWPHLGIPRDSDAAAVRRAYAEVLKRQGCDGDPAEFQALRAEYEAALGLKRAPSIVMPERPVVARMGERNVSTSATTAPDVQAILALIGEGNLGKAMDRYDAFRATTVLDLDTELRIEGALAEAVLARRLPSLASLQAIADRYGWLDVNRGLPWSRPLTIQMNRRRAIESGPTLSSLPDAPPKPLVRRWEVLLIGSALAIAGVLLIGGYESQYTGGTFTWPLAIGPVIGIAVMVLVRMNRNVR